MAVDYILSLHPEEFCMFQTKCFLGRGGDAFRWALSTGNISLQVTKFLSAWPRGQRLRLIIWSYSRGPEDPVVVSGTAEFCFRLPSAFVFTPLDRKANVSA